MVVGPQPSSLVVVSDKVIPAQWKEVVTAPLESPLGVENGLVEPGPEAHAPEGIYIARTPTCMKGKLSKLQSSWERTYNRGMLFYMRSTEPQLNSNSGTVFSVRSVPRCYKLDSWSNELVVRHTPTNKNVSTEAEHIVGIYHQVMIGEDTAD
jgi:hypothetical protein